jgi:hypothetical protein
MHKLPVFGYTSGGAHQTDYEWPTADDIRAMSLEKPIKVSRIKWKRSD